MSEPITSFSGPYRFLSNFYPCKVNAHFWKFPAVVYECRTVEHAYQAMKCHHAADFYRICKLVDEARHAKREGRKVVIRPDWEQVKLAVMADLVLQKFTVSPVLRQLLLDTGDSELVEGNNWGDVFWGQVNGQGENHLGKTLMDVRSLHSKLKENDGTYRRV